jgi:hypothetical protein
MNYQLYDRDVAQLYKPYLLMSESIDEHNLLRNALQQQIQPETFIEHIWVADLVDGEHELRRLRRSKAEIVKSKTSNALRSLLLCLLIDVHDSDIDRLVNKWFTNKAVRRTVCGILRTFGLDEASIDAEAFRLSIADIALFDRRMAELERRREDILRQIEDHRAGLASKVTAILDQPPEYNALLPHRAGSD